MKLVVVLVISLAVVFSSAENEFKAQLLEWREECLKETKVEQADAREALKSKIDDISENVLCFFKCIMEKRGILRSDGKIIVNAVDIKKFSHLGEDLEKEHSKMEECVKTVGSIVECGDIRKLAECAPKWLMH